MTKINIKDIWTALDSIHIFNMNLSRNMLWWGDKNSSF